MAVLQSFAKSYLDSALDSGALHSAGDIDCVAPDVIIEFGGAYDARGDVAKVESYSEHEVELDEGAVELPDGVLQFEDELHQLVDVFVLVSVGHPDLSIHSRRRHERRADRLYLLHVGKLGTVEDLVKVADQLVQDPQVL